MYVSTNLTFAHQQFNLFETLHCNAFKQNLRLSKAGGNSLNARTALMRHYNENVQFAK